MKRFLFLALILPALAARAQSAATTTLTVNVSGFNNTKGSSKVWLFNTADGFPSEDKKAVRCIEVPIKGTAVHCVFDKLPPGTYAVGVVHDENANHKFDTNFMGIPKEQYGASRGVRGGVGGPPKFAPAAFPLPAGGATIAIVVQ